MSTSGHKQYTIKKSVGIILYDKSAKHVLMIQKRHSYAYMDFIMGKYNKNNRRSLLAKLNNMTVQEKLLVKSLDFDMMWYHLFLSTEKNNNYYKCLAKFTNSFLVNNVKFLKSLLNGSTRSIDLMWEPPKGRISNSESNIACGMRELREETGISMKSYKIIKGEKVKKSIIIDKTKYIIYYYIARCKEEVKPSYNINNITQSIEIANTKWIAIKDLHAYTMINDIKQAIISKYKKLLNDKDLSHTTIIDILN